MNISDCSELLCESLNNNSGFFFRKGTLLEEGKTLFQAYEVWDTPQFGKLFRLDGYFMTSERDEFFYHENMVHPALVTHPDPKAVLIIGGGDGGSAEEVFKHPSIERIVLVELDKGVIDLARRFFGSIHRGSLDDPRMEILIEDGLKYVREIGPGRGDEFDIVVLDLTDPIGPATELYTPRFMADCKALLNSGGMFVLHIGSPVFEPGRVSGLMKSLESVFHHVAPYFAYVPLYGTLWGMACASDLRDPRLMDRIKVDEIVRDRSLQDLQYYNGSVHEAGFALPEYIKKILSA
ncbi:MAG: putative spermidine synthase [Euryarchaeota archaeon ADurb.Bin165]|jgi:spermidine synthase|nr:MAG: putative spermidine synthase [Euryarchaeota archaeon ADurb.Bin165]